MISSPDSHESIFAMKAASFLSPIITLTKPTTKSDISYLTAAVIPSSTFGKRSLDSAA
jgi:hypothetical protein